MKVIPIAAYLSEFNDQAPFDHAPMVQNIPELGSEIGADFDNLTAPLLSDEKEPLADDLLQKSFEEGVLEGKKQADIELSSQLEAQKDALTNQFNQEIAKLQGDLAEQLAATFKAEFGRVETTIANSVASIIKPFISGALEVRILNELTTAISDILNDPQSSQITVSGPKNLLEALAAGLDTTTAAIIYVETDDLEIRVEHGCEKIETRLTAWADLIKSQPG